MTIAIPTSIEFADKVTFRKVGLHITTDLTPEQYEHLGATLRMMEGAVQWWVGDWALWGENRYGEGYVRYIEATGYTYDTITNQVWVASRFPLFRRRENLSWSHHQVVAAKDVAEQETLLDWAAAPLRETGRARNVHALRNKAGGKAEYKELLSYDTPGGLRITISRQRGDNE